MAGLDAGLPGALPCTPSAHWFLPPTPRGLLWVWGTPGICCVLTKARQQPAGMGMGFLASSSWDNFHVVGSPRCRFRREEAWIRGGSSSRSLRPGCPLAFHPIQVGKACSRGNSNLVLETQLGLLSPLEHRQPSVSAFLWIDCIAPSDPEPRRLLLSHAGPLSCRKGCVAVTAVPAIFLLHLLHTRCRDPQSHCDNILF